MSAPSQPQSATPASLSRGAACIMQPQAVEVQVWRRARVVGVDDGIGQIQFSAKMVHPERCT